MFALTQSHSYYMYRQPADMRKGFDGLSGLVRNEMDRDPEDGSVYLFVNRKRDRLKILLWSAGGFVLYYKRLESGTYELPSSISSDEILHINWETLVLMVRGIRLEKIRRKKRYTRA